jgi:phage terminase large subunit
MSAMAAETERWVDAEIPEKLAFFNEWGQWRYKVVKGGRGKGASRTISTVLSATGAQRPLRWFCARETQKSQRFSSMQLIEDSINRLGLHKEYTIIPSDKQIRGNRVWPDGRRSIFTFEGLRELSVDSIKSLEDFDGIWLAEAHEIAEESWNKIVPTFRKDQWICTTCWKGYPPRNPPSKCSCGGSIRKDVAEIWADFNPEFEEDFICRWCDEHATDERAKIVHANYYDNPWFPDVLRSDMLQMKEANPDMYRHVWLGHPRNNVVGAVFGKEMEAAVKEGRIVAAPGIGIDRSRPVDTYWDLGHGDSMAIWFAQPVSGWFNLIDYYENSGEAIEHYVAVLRGKGYNLGICWLPHDGVDALLHHNLTGSNQRSPEMVLRQMDMRVRVAPKTSVDSGLGAVRTIWPQLRFDAVKCHEGINHLRRYQWGPRPEDGRVLTKPKHDGHSHGADALRTLAVSAKEPRTEPVKYVTYDEDERHSSGFSWG